MTETELLAEFEYPTAEDAALIRELSAKAYNTEGDSFQTEARSVAGRNLTMLSRATTILKRIDGEIAGWAVAVPTSARVMQQFLTGEMSEAELYKAALQSPDFACLYLMEVVVRPPYRGNGLGTGLFANQVQFFREVHQTKAFFTWVYSPEGGRLMHRLEKQLDITIHKLLRDT